MSMTSAVVGNLVGAATGLALVLVAVSLYVKPDKWFAMHRSQSSVLPARFRKVMWKGAFVREPRTISEFRRIALPFAVIFAGFGTFLVARCGSFLLNILLTAE